MAYIPYQYPDPGNEDYEPPDQRRNCRKCGGFLSAKPTGEYEREWEVFEWDAGYMGQVPRNATDDEIAAGKATVRRYEEPYWDCARCCHRHEAGEMWD